MTSFFDLLFCGCLGRTKRDTKPGNSETTPLLYEPPVDDNASTQGFVIAAQRDSVLTQKVSTIVMSATERMTRPPLKGNLVPPSIPSASTSHANSNMPSSSRQPTDTPAPRAESNHSSRQSSVKQYHSSLEPRPEQDDNIVDLGSSDTANATASPTSMSRSRTGATLPSSRRFVVHRGRPSRAVSSTLPVPPAQNGHDQPSPQKQNGVVGGETHTTAAPAAPLLATDVSEPPPPPENPNEKLPAQADLPKDTFSIVNHGPLILRYD